MLAQYLAITVIRCWSSWGEEANRATSSTYWSSASHTVSTQTPGALSLGPGGTLPFGFERGEG
jgi:hypothetical protein